MAITATSFTPGIKRFAYIAPVAPPDSWLTPIPRGEALFAINDGSVLAAAAGASQSFSITCVLPSTFAYIMMEASIELYDQEAGDIATWDSSIRCSVREDVTAPAWTASPRMDAGSTYSLSAVLKGKSYQVADVPRKMIVPGIAGGLAYFEAMTTTIDLGILKINALIKFLEFDLNQAHYYAVNTPVPVR